MDTDIIPVRNITKAPENIIDKEDKGEVTETIAPTSTTKIKDDDDLLIKTTSDDKQENKVIDNPNTIYFKYIFNNQFLRSKVNYFIRILNNPKKEYLDWIIENVNYNWMLDWFNSGKKPILIYEKRECIFKIKEIEIFKRCFIQYRDYFPIGYSQCVTYASKYNNIEAAKYLIGLGYQGDPHTAEYVAEHSCTELMDLLKTHKFVKFDTVEVLSKLINNCSSIYVFHYFFETFPTVLNTYWVPLIGFSRTKEIFELLFEKAKDNNPEILINIPKILRSTSDNEELFKFAYNRLLRLDPTITRYPFTPTAINVVKKNNIGVLTYFYQLKLCLDSLKLAKVALGAGHMECFLLINCMDPIEMIKMDLNDLSDSLFTLENIKGLVELGFQVQSDSLVRSVYSLDLFLYLSKQFGYEFKITENNIKCSEKSIMSSVINGIIQHDNIALLNYFVENGLEKVHSLFHQINWINLGAQNKSVELFEMIFNLCEEHVETSKLVMILDRASISGNIEIFKVVFNKLNSLKSDWGSSKCFSMAAQYGQIPVIEFLLENKIPAPLNLIDSAIFGYKQQAVQYLYDHGITSFTDGALETAATNGYLINLKFLFNKMPDQAKSKCTGMDLCGALYNNHKSTVQFLFDHVDSYDPAGLVMESLGRTSSLDIVKCFLKNEHKFKERPHYQKTFDKALSLGQLDIIEYLYENRDCTFNKHNLLTLYIHNTHSHILEYFKKSIAKNIMSASVIPTAPPLSPQLQFKEYMLNYIKSLDKNLNRHGSYETFTSSDNDSDDDVSPVAQIVTPAKKERSFSFSLSKFFKGKKK
ncbi:hypothetical protein CYY_009791 [Polysphondylium violaceum]|uniref:Ankyrin repeat-containing protein n=1 Tax=Polysphondylium violaceum TaxID=133409 RepID=A0A8J4PKV7_9MYCE|nr:hypothetical protein CYY_009791 [Polysphondylium violaceum]